jgi:uncharacterized protein
MEMRSIELLDRSLVPPIVERCRQQLMMHYRDRLKSIVLYGSAARQEMTDESDIDLLVILTKPLDYFVELRTIVELIYPLQMEASHWISAKPAEAEAFEAGAIQLYRNVLREGVIL